MSLIILVFLLILGSIRCLEISQRDFDNNNITCDGKSVCGKDSSLLNKTFWWNRNCLCDPTCAQYEDCCMDSGYFVDANQRKARSNFSCLYIEIYGIYMITTCPPEWKDNAVRLNCENSSTQSIQLEHNENPIMDLPITSQETRITYRNVFCALCNGENKNSVMRFWDFAINCESIESATHDEAQKQILSELIWNPEITQWSLNNSPCFVGASIPFTIYDHGRSCIPNLIKTCAVNWTNVDVRRQCESYTQVVYDKQFSYRNPHCAICNHVPINSLSCDPVPVGYWIPSNHLFDVKNEGVIGKNCIEKNVYDPFKKNCLQIFCDNGKVNSAGDCE